MVEYNYNFEVATNLSFFQSVMDDIVIKRYDHSTGRFTDSIKVNMKFGPKTRLLEDKRGQADTIKFPAIAITTNGMKRDNDRIKNKLEPISYKTEDGQYVTLYAIPWNIDVTMHILTTFQEDVDQIVMNFATISNPYVVYSWQEPKSGRQVRSEIHWSGEVQYNYPTVAGNLDSTTPWKLEASTTFTIKTHLYRTSVENVKPICKINLDVIPVDKFYCDYPTLSAYGAQVVQDNFDLYGYPQLKWVDNYYFKVGDTPRIKIQGEGMGGIYGLFLSGSNPQMYPLTQYYPTSGSDESFYGYAVESFEIPNTQEIIFDMPAPSAFGFCDIVAVNKCGWSKLTVDANRCNRVLNPYPTSLPEHYSWCVEQYPYLNGLIISNNLNDNLEIDCETDIIVVENDVVDRDSILEKIRELMELGGITAEEL